MKILRIMAGVFLILLVGLIVFKNPIIRWAVTTGVTVVTGAPAQIDSLAVGILKPAVRMKGFRLYNPKGFPAGALLDIAEVSVDYDLLALLKGRLHLPLLVIHLKEAVIVRNKEGQLNVDALNVVPKSKSSTSNPGLPGRKDEPASKPMALRIDVMKLDLGRVVYKDYTKGPEPKVTAFDARIHGRTYKNITSAQQVVTILMMESLGPTAIKSAGIYAAATVLGVAFLPAGIAGMMIGKDSGTLEFPAGRDTVYQAALTVVMKRGRLELEKKDRGLIKAAVDGASVVVEITPGESGKARVTVSARKLLVPRPEIAEGILSEMKEVLK